jgi:hypothetical protein
MRSYRIGCVIDHIDHTSDAQCGAGACLAFPRSVGSERIGPRFAAAAIEAIAAINARISPDQSKGICKSKSFSLPRSCVKTDLMSRISAAIFDFHQTHSVSRGKFE